MARMPEELFESIMRNAPIYPSSEKALDILREYLSEYHLDYNEWKQVEVSRPSKLNMERLPIGYSFCLTYDEFEKVSRRRFENVMDNWRRTKNDKTKFAIIKHKSLFVYEIARIW